MLRRIFAIAEKELLLALRDMRSLMLMFFIPVLMLVLYAYAINFDIKNIKLGVLDLDKSSYSRELLETFENTDYFTLTYYPNRTDLLKSLDRNNDKLVIIIPSNFTKRIIRNENTGIVTVVDGSDSNTARLSLNYFLEIYSKFLAEKLDVEPGRITDFEKRVLFNQEMKTLHFVVPGLIAILLMIIGVELTATSIVKEKEDGTVETLYTTPITGFSIIIGKLIPYLVVSVIDGVLVLLVSIYWFKVPFVGSFWIFLLTTFLFVMTCLAFGIFMSTLAKTQQATMTIAFLTSLLPSIILSGFIVPIENMPEWLQYITYLVPARYFIVIIRDIFLKGNPMTVYATEIYSLIIFSTGALLLAVIRMKKRID